eukprot:SAG22_NODE_186_length_15907_cov_45.496774_2_plen_161_part_00
MRIADKGPVGQRLAWGARALAYGEKIPYKNPALQSATLRVDDGSDSDSAGASTIITLKFDVPVELRNGHVGFLDLSIKPYSKAWLTVNGVNATRLAANAAGEIEVTTAAPAAGDAMAALITAAEVEYLQGDWPIPSIYAKGSGVPGLPAAPFITTANRLV